MNQRAIFVAVGLFLVIVLSLFAYAYFKSNEINNAVYTPPVEEETIPVTQVDAKHFFEDGSHTVVGELMMPTPCDLLEADATIQKSDPEQVTIELTVINNAEVCAQVVTTQRFRVDFDASIDASIDATLKGEPVKLNLIPARSNETPDDFELFIKG